MRKNTTGLLKTLSLLVFSFFIVILFYFHLPFIFIEKKTCFYIQPNESFHVFLKNIPQKTRHISLTALKIYSRLNGIDHHLEAGEYCFTSHDSIADMMKKINRGERESHHFTIINGWRYQDMADHLMLAPSLYHAALIIDKPAITKALQLSASEFEGQFYPETYDYAYPDTPIDILRRAHLLMKARLNALYENAESKAYFTTPDELLIAASIIEKESGLPEDQQLIAGVIINRLNQHMKLQMDPTVIYGLGKSYSVALTRKDLKSDTPYNTYMYKGLPPTPICMPGETALYAAAHPKASKYLYYVSKKNGYHQFSETLTEQTMAIKKYLLPRDFNPMKS